MAPSTSPTLLVAGATGTLGHLIALDLAGRPDVQVRALVRDPAGRADPAGRLASLRAHGVALVPGDLNDPASLQGACRGVDVVVSAVSGLREVVVDGQLHLIRAAEASGVTRLIPSDYAVDYFKLAPGDNAFLDYRREVASALQASRVTPTFILNGAFTDVLLAPWNWQFQVSEGTFAYYGDGEQPCDFTATQDVARYTAAAALDEGAAGLTLKFAGDVLSMRQVVDALNMSADLHLEGRSLGTLDDLQALIAEKRRAATSVLDYVFYQYHWAMVSGLGQLDELHNARYPEIEPVTLAEFAHRSSVRSG